MYIYIYIYIYVYIHLFILQKLACEKKCSECRKGFQKKSLELDKWLINAHHIPFSDDVTCLGVVFDNEFKFSTHIKRLAGKWFYHLRQMRSVRRRCGKSSSQCIHNKSNWLLQQRFQSGYSDSSSSATITIECSSVTNRKEAQVRPDCSNHP